MPPAEYFKILFQEMRLKLFHHEGRMLDTIYFGGGTPSLVPAEYIVATIAEVEKLGLQKKKNCEITIEINPATIDKKKMDLYLRSGVNRFSVGAQTFDDHLLKLVHREHNAQQTMETLDLLKSYGVNYSFDVLFALPQQTLDGLKKDLDVVARYMPPHVSPYCLTVPENHVLAPKMPHEDRQVEMFEFISSRLVELGYSRYEISNFCLPGFESRHNGLYWSDDEYLGLGLSSHSYLRQEKWGVRFWNPRSINDYALLIEKQVHGLNERSYFLEHSEVLEVHQSLTDFCHISLRTLKGLSSSKLQEKFGAALAKTVHQQLEELATRGWVAATAEGWALTNDGVLLSNQVFAALTFLKGELPDS